MTTTTEIYRALPPLENGPDNPYPVSTAWIGGPWKYVATKIKGSFSIWSVTFSYDLTTTTDTTYEHLIEIATGTMDNPTLIAQIPYGVRFDTKVGHFFTDTLFLPEPIAVADGCNSLMARIQKSSSSTAFSGQALKVGILGSPTFVTPNQQNRMQNFMSVGRVENGF